MPTGTIRKLMREKGYGFIQGEDGSDLFFHRSALKETTFASLKEGDRVEFSIEQGPKGPRATKISLVKKTLADL